MKRSRVALMICGVLVASTFASIAGSAPASAAVRNLMYDCMSSAPITLNVNAGDTLSFNTNCGAGSIVINDLSVVTTSNANFNPNPTIQVSGSLIAGTYANAFELFAASHTVYTLVIVGTGLAAPTISSISPTSGPLNTYTQITINGSGFVAGVGVKVGGSDCPNVSYYSDAMISCSSPWGVPAGPADVVVTNPDSQSATLTGAFTYYVPISTPTITSVNPPSGIFGAGTVITITGTGFVSGATVKIGQVTCSLSSVTSATSISCNSPLIGVGVKDVTVTNTDTGTVTAPSAFTVLPASSSPTITSISPNRGSTKGGTRVTITGTGFNNAATVTIGGSSATVISRNGSTSILVRTPSHARGSASVVVTNPDTGSATYNSFTYIKDEESREGRNNEGGSRERS